MAGVRGRLHKSAQASSSASPRRSLRRGRTAQEIADVPDVFHDLISESEASKAAGPDEDGKPLKRRKTAGPTKRDDASSIQRAGPSNRHGAPSGEPEPLPQPPLTSPSQTSSATKPHLDNSGSRHLQTVEASSESDDSDLEWEDALGQGSDDDEEDDFGDDVPADIGDVSITIGGDKGKEKEQTKRVRRRGITSIDKKLRLDVHKMHLLCLLYHVRRRNFWCNDDKVHATLRRFAPPQTLSKLVPNPEHTQYQASKRFIEAMQDLKQRWTNRFTLSALGMHKARWLEAVTEINPFAEFDELDDIMDRSDFRKISRTLSGSQDVGAQLFCALLRSIGVEARLVCSLQCLPFASAAQSTTPQKPISDKSVIHLDPYNRDHAPSPVKAKSMPSRPKRLSRLERVLGERNPVLSSGVAPKQSKRYHAQFPVYWVEAFNSAQQRWVTIDPLATLTLDKPEKLEPPLNHSHNSLVYAIAFEDDGFAKDVTRRYAKAYNAKTRKFRVDFTEGGAKWWRRTLAYFRRPVVLDRDQVEDITLAHREAAEGIPKNVQDFKNHPVYVLERHLRHNEVINPMQPAGKVNVGTALNPKMESIYRRKNVHIVRSADKWYRLGRDVMAGEFPLKHAKPKKRAINPLDMDLDQQEDEVGAGLYAEFQTEVYVPPPVVGGRVPRNAFGNLDLYVPSMVPEGGVHVRHKLASKAARLVGVDYVDAVTGFSFKGRHGTAIIQGVVVAREFQEAVEATIESMEYTTELAEQTRRTSEALRLWRRFCLGLRIAKRINAIEIDGEAVPVVDFQEEIDIEDRTLQEKELAGGFFVDDRVPTEPSGVRREHRRIIDDDDDEYMAGGFMAAEDDQAGGFVPEDPKESSQFRLVPLNSNRPSPEPDHQTGGGFIAEEDYLMSGGFIPEDSGETLSRENPPARDIPSSNIASSDGNMKVTNETEGISPQKEEEVMPEVSVQPIQDLDVMEVDHQGISQALREVTTPEVHVEDVDVKNKVHATNPKALSPAQPEEPPQSSPSEAGSLPLEDPDDEDAEPDWLLDAT